MRVTIAILLFPFTAPNHFEMNASKSLTIALFRNDLRLHDNPIVSHSNLASNQFREEDLVKKHDISHFVLPLYVFDERQIALFGLEGYQSQSPPPRTPVCGFWRTGCHRLKFLTESVYNLKQQLRKKGSDLLIRFGLIETTTIQIIKELQKSGFDVKHVYMSKEVAYEEVGTEKKLAKLLANLNPHVPLTLFHSRSLVHPDDLPFAIKKTPDVYTPFRTRVEGLPTKQLCRPLLPLPDKLRPYPILPESILKASPKPGYSGSLCDEEGLKQVLDRLMKPILSDPDITQDDFKKNQEEYQVDDRTAFPYEGGETEALRRLEDYFFKVNGDQPPPVRTYKTTRNGLLGHSYSTKFSPFLALGCISPRKVIHSLWEHEGKFGANKDTYWVLFEVLWRDYFIFITQKFGKSLFLLEGFEGKLDAKAAAQKVKSWKPFRDEKMIQHRPDSKDPKEYVKSIDKNALAWIKGKTGVPFLDANLIELRRTGFMSNRGRQNVASFLTKDLYIDWRIGAEFFESYLLDYDPCSNYGNWQYVAGVGNDPRSSRQFNPIKQAKDYDAQGNYVKFWIPYLDKLPENKAHVPWLLNNQEWENLKKLNKEGEGNKNKNNQSGGDGDGDYPRRPLLEQQSWKKHYQRR